MLRALARIGVLSTIILLASAAGATPYWIAWEGTDWPENQGWTRSYNNNGDLRSLHLGVMTLDGVSMPGGSDSYSIARPGATDPDPGELFLMQWRLRVVEVPANRYDPMVGVLSDDGWIVLITYSMSRFVLPNESITLIDFEPGLFHSYELRSADMRTYHLFVDDVLVRVGAFTSVVTQSKVAWGDGGVPTSSVSDWDYFRVGVVPEPSSAMTVALFGVVAARVRRK